MSDRDMVRIEELLVDRALGQLGEDQEAELRALLSEDPRADSDDFEVIAAELTAALLAEDGLDVMPAELADAIVERAPSAGAGPVSDDLADTRAAKAAASDAAPAAPPRADTWVAVSGWIAAAALVVWLLLPGGRPPEPDPEPTLAQQRDSLIAAGTQVVQIPWSATEDPAAVAASGDVVWSTSLQTGFMRFAGLETNEPTVFQYQLWIFDRTRDERYPVDGGVFDIGPEGEVIVRIDPKIEVRDPTLFAITVEQPGGVVVSDRERIVLVAPTE